MAQPSSSVLTLKETESAGPFVPQILKPLIIRAIPLAQAPLSNSPLVAVGRGSSGRTFLGVTVELPGLPRSHSIHAEHFLVTIMALNLEKKLYWLAISENGSYFQAPCRHSCQILQEIGDASHTQVMITGPNGNVTYKLLSTCLPQRFSPYNVIPVNVPRLLDVRNNMLILMDSNVARNICVHNDRCNHLTCRALAAANRSYTPYSNFPSGVALLDCQGKVYSGWRMECGAFDPSLGPVQAALIDFVANGGGQKFENIVEAVLVEKGFPVSSQEATARMILEKITNNNCIFNVWHCYKPAKSSD